MVTMGWTIGIAIILLLVICLIFMIRHFYDCPACSLADESKYRGVLCKSVHRDFEGALEQLLEILDGIQENTRQAIPQAEGAEYEVTNQFYKSAKDIYNKCLQVEKTIREIWSNPKYTKDFYFFAGLHFSSRFLTNILSAEQHNLKHFLQACAEGQQVQQQKIEALKAQRQETEEFEERRRLGEEIEESTQAVKDLANLITKFGEVKSIYAERVNKQAMETNRRAEFIATHFKRMGPEWKQTMSIRPRKP